MKIAKLDTVWCPLCTTTKKPIAMVRKDDDEYPDGIIECPICKYTSPILIVNHRSE